MNLREMLQWFEKKPEKRMTKNKEVKIKTKYFV